MTRIAGFVVLGLVTAGTALGQSFNIDFGPSDSSGPSADYAAAGVAGVWNSIEAEHTSIGNPTAVYQLVDLDGNETDVRLHQFGGTDLQVFNDPSLSGDDAVLMNDTLLTHSSGLESCMFINNLEPGFYEVISYGWMPLHPETRSRVRVDFVLETPDVGGEWPGGHVEGVTYAVHVVEVGPNGFMGTHSGNVPGADLAIGASYNGMQIQKIEDCATFLQDTATGTSFGERAFDGYVDPRIESSNGVDFDLGITEITLEFNLPVRDAGSQFITPNSFSLTQTGGGDAPVVQSLFTEDARVITLNLNGPLTPGEWTTVDIGAVSDCSGEPLEGETTVRIGFLPGDVNQNGVVQPTDLFAFRQLVNNLATPDIGVSEDYIDTNRDGSITPIDLFRFRGLINGVTPATQSWAGASLP